MLNPMNWRIWGCGHLRMGTRTLEQDSLWVWWWRVVILEWLCCMFELRCQLLLELWVFNMLSRRNDSADSGRKNLIGNEHSWVVSTTKYFRLVCEHRREGRWSTRLLIIKSRDSIGSVQVGHNIVVCHISYIHASHPDFGIQIQSGPILRSTSDPIYNKLPKFISCSFDIITAYSFIQ
jgi:hypothetical protein